MKGMGGHSVNGAQAKIDTPSSRPNQPFPRFGMQSIQRCSIWLGIRSRDAALTGQIQLVLLSCHAGDIALRFFLSAIRDESHDHVYSS